MIKWLLKSIVGNKNQREIKKILPLIGEINAFEESLQKGTEEDLIAKTAAWKSQLDRYHLRTEFFSRRKLETMSKEELVPVAEKWAMRFAELADEFSVTRGFPTKDSISGMSAEALVDKIRDAQETFTDLKKEFPAARKAYLEEILPEAYAVVKNAARRLFGTEWVVCDHMVKWEMVHFDVQLIGGIALHRGMIAEMATGEGKTLVATLPVFLNALTGLGVHVVTVNDYLARRDSEWMGHLFQYLGLTIGCIQNNQRGDLRREQYQRDITYGTASEFGFDYLRDNGMAQNKEDQVQRNHYFSLIDEVDSVLIDEARTPLIISGPVPPRESDQLYNQFKSQISALSRKQTQLLNGVASEAKKEIEAGNVAEGGLKYFKVKLGQPDNRALKRAMEDPDIRKLVEKAELEFFKDVQKSALFELKEELFFTLDEKNHEAELTEQGRNFLSPDEPDAFVLPDMSDAFSEIDGDESMTVEQKEEKKQEVQRKTTAQAEKMHTISQLMKAYTLYEKDKEYTVQDNKVIIIDENTGRPMPGRRWSDGLHQAVEAKEGVKIENETQTYATITIQNYFRLYEKLGGMTGTAETEAAEFHDIYKLDVLTIPTNRPNVRIDLNDKIYKTQREKFKAVIDAVKERNEAGQPVLLGTASVLTSEVVSRMMKREKIPHSVLNAKHHLQEAEIVSNAGKKGGVTVATNMAGRGTDIKLGEGVKDLGGLYVIATERHQSRRIDRQLRGRCSRQGDPGNSVFFVSFEDELMVRFGAAERMTKMMDRFGLEEGQELEHQWLNKSVENAQKKVEERNYLSRKNILEYDDVMNNQRGVVYGYRNEVIQTEDPHALVLDVIEEQIPGRAEAFYNDQLGDVNWEEFIEWINLTFPVGIDPDDADFKSKSTDGKLDMIIEKVKAAYNFKCGHEDPDVLEDLERHIILKNIDDSWQEHLYEMDGLRDMIGNYKYAQKDPLVEYKHEAYKMFTGLMDGIRGSVLESLFRLTTRPEQYQNVLANMKTQLSRPDVLAELAGAGGMQAAQAQAVANPAAPPQPQIAMPVKREAPKVGRNEPCPCGSGKKFKVCCGKL